MNKEESFKITVTQYDTTITIEKDYSDVDIYEYGEMLLTITRALGFAEESIAGIFITEYNKTKKNNQV